jgi:hypothetical protein
MGHFTNTAQHTWYIRCRAGSVSVFQVGVGYRLFFSVIFSSRSVFGFGFYKNIGFGVGFGFFKQHNLLNF